MGTIFALFLILFALPFLFAWKENYTSPQAGLAPFTVTVDPEHKTITENPAVEEALSGSGPNLQAAVGNLTDVFEGLSAALSQSSVYQMLASAGAPQFVVVEPGFRKEEVAQAFADALKWDKKTKAEFLKPADGGLLSEGTMTPGMYAIETGAGGAEAQSLTDERFKNQILSRYGTSTSEVVPIDEALTIASLIQRETADKQEMRLISGIIWNRIFNGMALQLDATLQYAKANSKKGTVTDWWPTVYPRDKYIKSPYNTYQNVGLPPTPISNPGVAAVIAALNPKKTDCLFYFHDKQGDFHCAATYEEHVKLLKKYFGRGR